VIIAITVVELTDDVSKCFKRDIGGFGKKSAEMFLGDCKVTGAKPIRDIPADGLGLKRVEDARRRRGGTVRG
jgi:hypothetical protein